MRKLIYLSTLLILAGCGSSPPIPIRYIEIPESVPAAPVSTPVAPAAAASPPPVSFLVTPGSKTKKVYAYKYDPRDAMIMDLSKGSGLSQSSNKESKVEKLKVSAKAKETEPKTKTPDEIIDQLSEASIAVGLPDSANIRDHIKMMLIIDSNAGPEQLEAIITIKGKKISAKIPVSKIVEVEVVAPDFDIKPQPKIRQALSETEPTIYEWIITPTKPCDCEISVSVYAEVNVDNARAVRKIKTFEKQMRITVTPSQWFADWMKNYWQWAFSTLIIPISLWLWGYWRRPKEEK